ncbi:MAG: efflux RND transporter periplasmic adaptor subunit [Prolixibacteraceae bacterium]|jgi:HlyD family secretion protein|nr:efflux RND transporter periplasmic adaptor subunit [Prolixibacteraceae bacterium]
MYTIKNSIPYSLGLLFSISFLSSCSESPNSIDKNQCIILTVEKGKVITPIKTSGVVEPESEVLIRCNYPSTIKKIIKEPGSTVQTGDLILVLDDQQIKSDIESIQDQLAIKKNSLEKNNLAETSTKIDLKYTEDVKKLNITSLKSQLSDEEQLLDVGGISPAKIEKTKQEIALAEKELLTLREKNSIKFKQLRAEEEGLLLGIEIQEKDLKDKLLGLEQMNVRSQSSGIVLAIGSKTGEKVNKDQVLVRISDLSSFKISGSIEEKMADYIKTGAPVYAVFEDTSLFGHIGIVSPIVENGKIQFNVYLEERSHPKLIPHQNIELWVAKNFKENALRLKNIPQFSKGRPEYLYVYKDGKAIKHRISTGYISPTFIEITDGVKESDQIIVPLAGLHSLKDASEIIVK